MAALKYNIKNTHKQTITTIFFVKSNRHNQKQNYSWAPTIICIATRSNAIFLTRSFYCKRINILVEGLSSTMFVKINLKFEICFKSESFLSKLISDYTESHKLNRMWSLHPCLMSILNYQSAKSINNCP